MASAKQRNNAGVRPWTITPRDVEDFRRAMELRADPAHADEYRALSDRLYFSFDCRLWIDDILDIEDWRPPAAHDLPEYERAYAIRQALEEASGIHKPQDAAGRPVGSLDADRLSDSQGKRATEALKRSRAG
jgi:hypothetical protein